MIDRQASKLRFIIEEGRDVSICVVKPSFTYLVVSVGAGNPAGAFNA